MNQAITKYISKQRYYGLPTDLKCSLSRVEVFNRSKNKGEIIEYEIVLCLNRKKRKTDEEIKIYYKI